MNHPSFLTLDRLALGVADASARAHVDGCDVCQRHMADLAAKPAIPAHLASRAQKRSWWPGAFSLAFGALATVALVFVLNTDNGDDLRAKGGLPSVAVFVKRGEEVFMWDQLAPLRSGDRVQLTIEPGPMRHVYVRDVEGRSLYSGALTPGVTTLPLSWRIEGAGASETLVVVLAESDKDNARRLEFRIVLNKEPLP